MAAPTIDAMTVDGTLKLWLLHSMGEMRDLFEEKSKALGISGPISIALIVCGESWQVMGGVAGNGVCGLYQ